MTAAETDVPFAFPVQWVEKFSGSSDTSQGRRVFWGRVATGTVKVGDTVSIHPSGQTAVVAQVVNHARVPGSIAAGHGAGGAADLCAVRRRDQGRAGLCAAGKP